MKYGRLGQTDIDVSVVCLGGWSLVGGGTWGPQDRRDSVRAIEASLEAGVNFFDTAEGYGNGRSERLFAEVLAPRRAQVVIASKVGPRHLAPEALGARCEESLRRLKTDYIDLYQVHWPNPDVPLGETLAALETLKAEGKVRAIGVSNFGVAYLEDLLKVGRVESNQVCYSLLFRAVEYEVLPLCLERQVGILAYSPLCQGLLTGKFRSADDVPEGRARSRLFSRGRPQSRHAEPGCEAALFAAVDRIREICGRLGKPMNQVALAWLLARDGVAGVIAGARNARQAAENARAADLELTADVLEALDDATDAVKQYAGANIDLWQTDSRADKRQEPR